MHAASRLRRLFFFFSFWMHTNRHHAALTLNIEALSKGCFGSSLISMDGCSHDRLLDQGIQVPENTSRAIPDWVFPNGAASPVQHTSRPDALFVRHIPGRQAQLDPTKDPPQETFTLLKLNSAPTLILTAP